MFGRPGPSSNRGRRWFPTGTLTRSASTSRRSAAVICRRRWLFASYAQNLSTRDSLKCRRLIEQTGVDDPRVPASERTLIERIGYRGLVELIAAMKDEEPWELTGDQATKQRFENTRNRLPHRHLGGRSGDRVGRRPRRRRRPPQGRRGAVRRHARVGARVVGRDD